MKNKLKVLTNCDIDPVVLLDYVEGELSSTLKSDLDLHLPHCGVCQKQIEEYKNLRRKMKSMSVDLPGDDFFKSLESKIMSSLDKPIEPIQDAPFARSGENAATWAMVRNFIIPFAATAALFLLVFASLFKSTPFNEQRNIETAQNHLEDAFIVQAATHDPKVLTDAMVSSGDSEDQILNAAAEKMARMSDREVRSLMKRMR